MSIRVTDTEARLEGDWTLTGVTRNLDSLANSLQQFEPGSNRKLNIDCGQMEKTDISGLQLLNVWLQCIKLRGVEPILVNVPEKLRYIMQQLNLNKYLPESFLGVNALAG